MMLKTEWSPKENYIGKNGYLGEQFHLSYQMYNIGRILELKTKVFIYKVLPVSKIGKNVRMVSNLLSK